MASTIINCSDLTVNDIKFYAPKVTQGGGKNVGMMNKSTHTALRMKLPIMFTFGASDYQDNKQYSCSLQFPDLNDEAVDPVYGECLARLVDFEAALKKKVFEFSKDWLGKQLKNEEMVDMIWSPMLKYPKNKETGEVDTSRAPTLSVKIPCFEGKWSSEVYDEDKNPLFPSAENPEVTPLNFITRGTNMATVVQCGGLWIVGGKMGVTWKLVQTIVKQQNTSIQGVCHIDLKETDKKLLQKKADLSKHQDPEEAERTTSSSSSAAEISTAAPDTDDEREDDKEEDEVDEEPTAVSPPPVPTPVPETETKKTTKGRGKK